MNIFKRTRLNPFSQFDLFMFGFFIGLFGITFIRIWSL